MSKLKIADGLSLPLDVVTQKLAWLGVTGSGKTYGASKLAELLWDAGAQIIVLDSVGVWYGLRLRLDGKGPSAITIPIFGGLHGDVPLEPTGGALLANLIVDKTLSAIIDLSQFESDADKARFARDFADRFFFRKKAAPSAVHLFLEECQELVPQNPQKGEERMLHAFVRMQKLGRNFGIGSSYISQRPQEVNKKALNMAQTLFVFRTTGTHERKAIESWIADKALDQDIAGDLPKIETGSCHVWSPEFLKISETVHIREKHTFNASATPEVGVVAKARELAPIDLDKVRADMAATIEKAKAEDPRELRKQIAELKKQVAMGIQKSDKPNPPPKTVEKFVLKDGQLARLEKIYDRMLTEATRHRDAMSLLWEQQSDEAKALLGVLQLIVEGPAKPIAPVAPRPTLVRPPSPPPMIPPRDRARPAGTADGALDGPQQKILDTVAMLNVRSIDATRDSVARWMTLHPNGGRFGTNLAFLRAEGYLDGFTLTDKGFAAARAIPTGLDEAKAPLDGPQREIVDVLASSNGTRFTRDTLAEALGLHPNGGRFGTNLARLRTMGLVPERGEIYLTEAAHR